MYQKQICFLIPLAFMINGCHRSEFASSAPSAETLSGISSASTPEALDDQVPNEADAAAASTEPAATETADKTPSEAASTVLKPEVQAGGVTGGHFDLDTSIQTYAFDKGSTVTHVHEYDDKFNTTGVDFFNLLDPKLVSPKDIIDMDQSFKIIVGNAQLSPGVRITINGQSYLATDWQKRSLSSDLPVFSFTGTAGTQKLTSLAIVFDPKKPIAGQLIPTETMLVRSNAQGPGGTYRAGALTVQMIHAKDGEIDGKLGVAKIGGKGMLWELTLFWHE